MRTAVLGTGIMGAAMARSLAREGHDVSVWNRTTSRSEAVAAERITACGDIGDAMLDADVVVLALFLILGGVIGAQLGVRAGERLRGEQLRLLLALLVLAVAGRLPSSAW